MTMTVSPRRRQLKRSCSSNASSAGDCSSLPPLLHTKSFVQPVVVAGIAIKRDRRNQRKLSNASGAANRSRQILFTLNIVPTVGKPPTRNTKKNFAADITLLIVNNSAKSKIAIVHSIAKNLTHKPASVTVENVSSFGNNRRRRRD